MTAAAATNSWTHREAVVNGVRLHYVEAGAGPLVVLLHGFPEFWYSWRHQIPALAAAGFRVLAPDLRGYNESDKPTAIHSYRLSELARDVAELVRHAGERRATIVGHDWGGGVAWSMPLYHPEVVERLVILNAPHPAAFVRELWTPSQLLKSWYMFLFQLPRLPEALLRSGNFAGLERTLRQDPVHRNAFTPEDVQRYKDALAQPGALTAALNWYRAAFRGGLLRRSPRGFPPIRVPTLLIWGKRDRYLGIRLTKDLGQWVPQLQVVVLNDASHWVQCDAPARVNQLMLDFLRTT